MHESSLVSVITVVRNGREFIENSIASVQSQTYRHIQYIVKDGRSTDGTLDILHKHRHLFAHLESSADAGISDAWNQGLEIASGDFILFLNCDDRIAPNFIADAVSSLRPTGAELAFGTTDLLNVESRIRRRRVGQWNPSSLWKGVGFLFPSVVATREAYECVGSFDTSLKYAMDADWLLRLHRKGARFISHRGVVEMSTSGVSNRHWAAARREYLSLLKRYDVPVAQRFLGSCWMGALYAKKALERLDGQARVTY